MKNLGGEGGDRERSEGLGGDRKKSDGQSSGGGGAVRQDSLGPCLMCIEVKNDHQKSSLLKFYLGWYKYWRRTFFLSRAFKIPKKSLEPSSRENVCLGFLGGLGRF